MAKTHHHTASRRSHSGRGEKGRMGLCERKKGYPFLKKGIALFGKWDSPFLKKG